MSFIIAGTAIAAVGAGYNIIDGISKENAGKRLAANNTRPWYNIPNEYQENDNAAASQAETGLAPSTVNYYTTQASRGLGSGISGILQGGGDVDNLSKLYDQFTQGLSQESAQDEQLKTQHLNTFINANKDLAGQKTQQWALNYYEPYKDTALLASAEKASGQQQIGTGIGEAVGAASSAATQGLYADRTAAMKSGQTMGEKLGNPELAAVSGGIEKIAPGLTTDSLPVFSTPGGSSVMGNLSRTDANSAKLQQLINILKSQPQSVN